MVNNLLAEHNVVLNDGYGTLRGRPIRHLEHMGLVQIGQEDFDRWGNSVEQEFEVSSPKGLRAFKRFLTSVAETVDAAPNIG